jgi:hypothetical protein
VGVDGHGEHPRADRYAARVEPFIDVLLHKVASQVDAAQVCQIVVVKQAGISNLSVALLVDDIRAQHLGRDPAVLDREPSHRVGLVGDQGLRCTQPTAAGRHQLARLVVGVSLATRVVDP